MADNQIDTGDLLECLVLNKHQKEMNEKCAVGVTHFQLVTHLQTPDLSFVSCCPSHTVQALHTVKCTGHDKRSYMFFLSLDFDLKWAFEGQT